MAEHAAQTAARKNTESAVGARQSREAPARQNARSENGVREWQHVLGNQAMLRSLLAGQSGIPPLRRKCASCAQESDGMPGPIQMKLTVNQPGDIFEQEADRVADAVMRMPERKTVDGIGERATGLPGG